MSQVSTSSNLLLAALDADDLALLRPHLTQVRLESHAVVQEADKPIKHIHFPLEGMVSVVAVMVGGETVEIAGIGREGAIGTKVGLQPQLAFAKAIVQLPGSALRMDLEKFQQAARQSLAITHVATCANDVMIANLQQSAACNAMHPVESRFARWLLHASDRFPSTELPLTQDFLSMMLGVRRTTVSLTAHALQKAGLIKYRRGKLELTDREGLEAVSCECYRAVRGNIEMIVQNARLAGNSGKR